MAVRSFTSCLPFLCVFCITGNCLKFVSKYDEDVQLQTKLAEGTIQGRIKHTVGLGMPYHSYEGIPYAKPPVGELRFQQPQPPVPWSGVLAADGETPVCIQEMSSAAYESEDCLYINVYVPKPSPETASSKAVMVWIYGGGFLFGLAKSDYYGPDFLLEEDVVVVHFGYRLNVFGFLSTGDMASSGNYGLKDQLAALKWVHNNIFAFGGDPNNVTIFGGSAGGASVQYHLLSPKSRNLFHKAISQSGSPLCTWAFQRDPYSIAYRVGLAGGFSGGNSKELVEYLKSLNVDRLKKAALRAILVHTVHLDKGLQFSPTLEPDHEDAFITNDMYDLLKKGEFHRIPYLVGFNSQEAGHAKKPLEVAGLALLMVPGEVLIPPGLNNKEAVIGETIKEFYFGNKLKDTTQQWLNYFSDSYFNRPITQAARMHSLYAPTYMYVFSYEGYYLGKRAFSMGPEVDSIGVIHSEEVWYLFSRDDLRHANSTDKLIRKRVVKLWTNFAKFGIPTPMKDELLQNVTWPEFHKDDYRYMDIGSDLSVRNNFRAEMIAFWEGIFAEYGRPPFYTY